MRAFLLDGDYMVKSEEGEHMLKNEQRVERGREWFGRLQEDVNAD